MGKSKRKDFKTLSSNFAFNFKHFLMNKIFHIEMTKIKKRKFRFGGVWFMVLRIKW